MFALIPLFHIFSCNFVPHIFRALIVIAFNFVVNFAANHIADNIANIIANNAANSAACFANRTYC